MKAYLFKVNGYPPLKRQFYTAHDTKAEKKELRMITGGARMPEGKISAKNKENVREMLLMLRLNKYLH